MPKSRKASGKNKVKVEETSVSSEILVPAKAKRLDDYDRTKPLQLTLFELLLPNEREFSNTVELYDFIPKYHWGKSAAH